MNDGAITLPIRQPVIRKFFENELMIIVLSLIPGRDAKGINFSWKLKAVYMSSQTTSKSCFVTISANFPIVSRDKQFPVGLDGLLISNTFVLGVIMDSRRSRLIWKSSSSYVGISTGIPPAMVTCLKYGEKHGD